MGRGCKKCGELKALEEFRTYTVKGKTYRRYVCNSCMDASAIQWREDNLERNREYNRQRYQKVREQEIARATEWNRNNPDRKRDNAKQSYARLREEIIMGYGGFVCQCCGETEPEFLCIDHVNNDGHLYRRGIKKPDGGWFKVGPHTGDRLLRWLKKNNFPEGFQVLCHNCNHSKRKRGVCIHQVKKV